MYKLSKYFSNSEKYQLFGFENAWEIVYLRSIVDQIFVPIQNREQHDLVNTVIVRSNPHWIGLTTDGKTRRFSWLDGEEFIRITYQASLHVLRIKYISNNGKNSWKDRLIVSILTRKSKSIFSSKFIQFYPHNYVFDLRIRMSWKR